MIQIIAIEPPLRDGQQLFCYNCHKFTHDALAVYGLEPYTFVCRPCVNAGFPEVK